jgi:hypothetical protein
MAGEQEMMAEMAGGQGGMMAGDNEGPAGHDTVTCPNCGAELIIELAAESAAEHQAMPEDLRGQIGAAMGQQGA